MSESINLQHGSGMQVPATVTFEDVTRNGDQLTWTFAVSGDRRLDVSRRWSVVTDTCRPASVRDCYHAEDGPNDPPSPYEQSDAPLQVFAAIVNEELTRAHLAQLVAHDVRRIRAVDPREAA